MVAQVKARQARKWMVSRPLVYEDEYVLLLILSVLDVALTAPLLLRGHEEWSVVTDTFIRGLGMPGLITFKMLVMSLVVILSEEIARRRPSTGRLVARSAVGCTGIAVALSLLRLLPL